MRLTFHTDYALRMLIHLAIHDGASVRVTDVAESYGLSRNHLLKVANRLSRMGFIVTSRGRAGGIALARSPAEINLGAVVRGMEDDFALVECMKAEGGACAIAPACRLKGLVAKALDAFMTVFDQYTLADIVKNKGALIELLGLANKSGEVA